MKDQKATIALVTGASDGIGKETARQLAAKGIHVLLGSRNLEKGQGVAQEFKELGLEVEVIQLDISDAGSVQAAAASVTERHERLDILVNNAGIFKDLCPISQLPADDLTATLNTNVVGTFQTTTAFLPLLRKSDHPRVVNVSSGLASLNNMTDPEHPYYQTVMPSYAASKAALNVLTIYLARELKDTGIKINAVCPGLTATRYVDTPGAHPVEVGAAIPVQYALINDDGPTGGFFDRNGVHNW